MIGVLAPRSDNRVVSEFFELFKTPWEYLQSDRNYEVILCVGDVQCTRTAAKLILHYADCPLPIDVEQGVDAIAKAGSELVSQNEHSLVIHGNHLSLHHSGAGGSTSERSVDAISYRCIHDGTAVVRIGYDLFAEIEYLLTEGQPEEFAHFPTLDLHICLLRSLIVQSGIELLEIPPVPDGYGCIASLTHDIDHPGIKFHRWDATAFGFLYRAVFGSFVDFCCQRLSTRVLIKNWLAAAKLPFVYLGWAEDFWAGFEGRYFEFEKGIRSTYFVVPFKNRPGRDQSGPAPRRRATGYGTKDIKESLLRIKSNGSEVALHGIDAWLNSESARRELEEVRNQTGDRELGVRMHWLFYGKDSPKVLEDAGALYDSTVGYRATVGFRSGTAQAYRPLGAERLLELPLHIMDSALFYPAYLGFSQKEAESSIRALIEAVAEVGGCLTVNWHDRSLAAERNWISSYSALIDELKSRNAWCAAAGEAVAWFRMRRSVVFETGGVSYGMTAAMDERTKNHKLPGLRVRRYTLEQKAAGALPVIRHSDSLLSVHVDVGTN